MRRHARLILLHLLCLPLIALFAGCGSTSSGSFTLGAGSSVTLVQGSSKTFTVTPTASGDFKGSVTVTASGLPAGVTLSPATASIPVGSSATFTATASSTATVGTSTVTLSGTSGSLNASTTVSLTVTASGPAGTPDFSFAVSPTSLSLTAGNSHSVTLTATALNNFTGNVDVKLSGLPAGVTVSPATITVIPGTPLAVTLTADDTVATTTAPVVVSFMGAAGALEHSATLALSLTGTGVPPGSVGDFKLGLSVPTLPLTAGGAYGQVQASITAENGFTGPVNVIFSGLPAGVTVTPDTSVPVVAGTNQLFRFTADATAAAGTTNVTLTGTAGTITHAIQLAVTVTAPQAAPDFMLALAPTTQTAAPGSVAMTTISATALKGYNGTIAVGVGGLPVGVTVSQPSFSLMAGTPVPLTFNIATGAIPGSYNVMFTGTSGTSLMHTVVFTLVITKPTGTADFSLTLSSPSLNIAQGAIGQSSLSAAALNGFTGSISVTASGMPTGVTLSPSSFNLAVGVPQDLTVTVAANATPGTYGVVLTGVSGTVTHAISLTLVITKAGSVADFSLALTPTTVSVVQGAVGQSSIAATALNGFTGSISVTYSGLPAGVTPSSASLTLMAGAAQPFSLDVGSSATPGTYNVVLTGVSGTLTHSVTLALTITKGTSGTGDFSLALAPASLSVAQGASSPVSLSATALNGFTGTIQVSTGTLPTGVVLTPASVTLTPGTPASITVAVSATAPTGTYMITFTGVNGTLTHSVALPLTVTASQPTSGFTITASPNTVSVPQGTRSGLVNIGVTGSNGFTGNVTLTVTGMPTGVTLSPPDSTTLQSGDSAPYAFNASTDAAIGNTTITITGVSGAITETATLTLSVTAPPPPDVLTVTLTPSSLTLPIGSVSSISVLATGPSGYTGQIALSIKGLPTGVTANPMTAEVTSGVAQTVVLTAGKTATAGSSTPTFTGKIASLNGVATLNLAVVTQPGAGYDVPTWHNDTGRTGLNAFETTLMPTNVKSASFGKLSSNATDGQVDAQPLFISNLMIGGQTHNVVYVATENDSVYAYDADNGSLLWQVSALGANERASDDHGCTEIAPQVGITATPVIDRSYGTDGAIFFVAMTEDSSNTYHQRLHALDLLTGAELSGSPTEITSTAYTGSGVTNTFDPSTFVERAALLLSNGSIYLTWAAPCQQTLFNYDSWVLTYSETTLQQQAALDLTPNGSGGAIWMSGAGPAADSNGYVFLITSKGTFDTSLTSDYFPVSGDYGNGYVELNATTTGALDVYDYFEPNNGVPGSDNYQDQGSGGVMLIPDLPYQNITVSLAVGAGRDGNIYEMNRVGNFLGEYVEGSDENAATITSALPNGATSSPAYFNQFFYYSGIGDSLKAIGALDQSGTVVSQSANTFGAAGATPVISANGTSNGIVWVLDTAASGGPVLHAYLATNVSSELYNSTQAVSNGVARDTIHTTGNYSVPLVVDGHVYIGTQSGVDIFGLLPQ